MVVEQKMGCIPPEILISIRICGWSTINVGVAYFQTTCDPKLRLTRVSEVSIFLVGHFKYFKQLGCFKFGQNLLSIAKIIDRSYRSQIAI